MLFFADAFVYYYFEAQVYGSAYFLGCKKFCLNLILFFPNNV